MESLKSKEKAYDHLHSTSTSKEKAPENVYSTPTSKEKSSENVYSNPTFQPDNSEEGPEYERTIKKNFNSDVGLHQYDVPYDHSSNSNTGVRDKKKYNKSKIVAVVAGIVVVLSIALALGIVFSGILTGDSDSVVDPPDSTTPVPPVTRPESPTPVPPVTQPPYQKPIWTTWEQWSSCDVSCGEGMQHRSRTCTDSIPEDDQTCVGKTIEPQQCAEWDCPDPNHVCSDGELNDDYDACECASSKLSGRVIDASNRPLSNAKIYYSTRPYKKLAITNSTGMFEADNVCSTSHLFLVKKDMFSSVEIYSQVYSSLMSTLIATLERIGLPYITQQPETKVRQVGDNVRFCCMAESTSPVKKFEWFKDDDIIETPNSDEESLVIENLRASDEGTYKCRVENEMGAIYSEPATLTVIAERQPICSPRPDRHFIILPSDCMQPDTNKAEYDVGTCGHRECLSTTKTDQTSCTDSEQEFDCCQPVESNVIDIQCGGYTIPVTKVVSCGCSECMKPRRKVIGRVLNAESGELLSEIRVYYNLTLVTGSDSMGTFTFEVPSQVRRVALTLKDDSYYPNPSRVIETTAVLNIGDVLLTYHTFSMKPVPTPRTMDDSSVENCIPFIGEGSGQVAELVVAPNTLYDNDGNMHQGSFNVSVRMIDMRNISDAEIAPGDFTTVDPEGNLAELKSYGMVSFDFTNMSGNSLQVGGSSMIRVNQDMIPACTFDDGGNCDTSLWWFNERSGTWEMASKLRETEGGRKRRQNGFNRPDIESVLDVGREWYNIDSFVESERCWAKLIAYETENLDPKGLLPYTSFTVETIIKEQGVNYLRFNNLVFPHAVGVCVPQACDSTNPNDSRFTARISVKYKNCELYPAMKSAPNFKLNSQDTTNLRYTVTGDQLSIKPYASADGPVYPGKDAGVYGACAKATTKEKHLQFYYPSSQVCPDVKCYTVESSVERQSIRSYLTFYPLKDSIGDEQDYCFIGIRVRTSTSSVQITVISEVGNFTSGGNINTESGTVYGRRELRAMKDDQSSESIDVCMEYKCSGAIYNPKPVANVVAITKITVDVKDAGSCIVREAASGFETHLDENEGINLPAEVPFTFKDSRTHGLYSGLHTTDDARASGECKNDLNSPQTSNTNHCETTSEGFVPAITITCNK